MTPEDRPACSGHIARDCGGPVLTVLVTTDGPHPVRRHLCRECREAAARLGLRVIAA